MCPADFDWDKSTVKHLWSTCGACSGREIDLNYFRWPPIKNYPLITVIAATANYLNKFKKVPINDRGSSKVVPFDFSPQKTWVCPWDFHVLHKCLTVDLSQAKSAGHTSYIFIKSFYGVKSTVKHWSALTSSHYFYSTIIWDGLKKFQKLGDFQNFSSLM